MGRADDAGVTRSRSSAKAAGSWFERLMADWLAAQLDDDGIDRQVKVGARDIGDIRGVKAHGQRIAVECKEVARIALPAWVREAEVERGNLDALAGVVIHKRTGTRKPEEQFVTMTAADFVALITGAPRETP